MDEIEEILQPYLKPFKGKVCHHIGSTSIKGMFGKPMPDFSVVTDGLLPDIPYSIINKFEAKGWKYYGPAPHSFNKNLDQWFFYDMTPEEIEANDGITAFICHIVSFAEAENNLNDFLIFRDYCNENESAHQRYSDIKKLGQKKYDNLMGY